ncbi:MAG: hypothetical protein HZA91_11405 [Verrucomicrobia bacterium]|nr:hypothetical protein [Verrucomicrobiota bacterium]
MFKKIAIQIIMPALVVLIGLAILSVFIGQFIPTSDDAEEAQKVTDAIEAKYLFRVMSAHNPGPAVYCRPHRAYSEIVVYGDYSRSEQDEICAVVRAVRREGAKKPIHLYVYPRELDRTGLMRKEIFE